MARSKWFTSSLAVTLFFSTVEPEQVRAGPADMARRKGAYTSRTLRAQCRKVVASHRGVRTARCHRLRWPGIS